MSMIQIVPLVPRGTNSTMFTECCHCAICDWEYRCPQCGQLVIGAEATTDGERNNVRWESATRFWRRLRNDPANSDL